MIHEYEDKLGNEPRKDIIGILKEYFFGAQKEFLDE